MDTVAAGMAAALPATGSAHIIHPCRQRPTALEPPRGSTHLVVEGQLALQVILSVAQRQRGGAGQRHALLPGRLLGPGDVLQLVVDKIHVVDRIPLGRGRRRALLI
jgi:hypothetical protein